ILVRRTYKPIQRMIQRANEIQASNLMLRLEGPKTGQELDQLARAFNGLFDRLEKAFQREKEFNAQVAHELRTPLTASRGQIEMILLDESLPQAHREALANSIEALDRLTYLINRMLFLSKAEGGLTLTLSRETIRLHALADEVCELTFSDDKERDARIVNRIPETLEWMGDKNMIFRLILNLIENAKKHTPEGTSITLDAMQTDQEVRLEVRDRGEGIAESERERIFEKFYSKSNRKTSARTDGAGLGLSIARTIARLHDGDLTCRETPGGGATFVCTFRA
ncbi:MAG: ATP-binding protein, partial [Planctomycetota bacterium]